MSSKTAARMLRQRAQTIDDKPAQETEEEPMNEKPVVETEGETVEVE
jgi:hypothetical protein